MGVNNKDNATCSICGKPYHMCLHCKTEIGAAPWKRHTDTVEHYKVFQVVRGYSTGVYDKSEAKEKLKNIDLSDMDTFVDSIKTVIGKIMEEEVSPEVIETEIEVPVVQEEQPVVAQKEQPVVHSESEQVYVRNENEQPVVRKRKRYKADSEQE